MDFRSDNTAGAHPAILEALTRENRGSASAYGEDAVSARLTARFSQLFEREVAVLPVATGTAANALALALYTPPWGAVYCHPHAHVQISECGAPEAFSGGAKLVSVTHGAALSLGKLEAEAVERTIHREGAVHAVQPAAISISQPSEIGTLYRPRELEQLAEVARRHHMALHVDGARFANALVALSTSPAELTWKAGVDVLSFGATKNGAMAAEAVVLFQPERAGELAFRRKRAGHLLSKSRFLAAQLEAYLDDDLWLANARHANSLARELADGFTALGVRPLGPVETNQVFVQLSALTSATLRARGFQFLDWPTLGAHARRLVTSFETRKADVDALLRALNEARQH
ncbi:MAG TPA: low specificity L-threonine aldolase, partial [Polyangiales bacterium]